MNTRPLFTALLVLLSALLLSSCAIIRPGEVGIKTRLGKIQGDARPAGAIVFNPFIANVNRIPVRTVELTVLLDVPTREGLNVKSEIVLLYRVRPDAAKDIYVNFGPMYESVVILPNFRSATRDISARFKAEDFYTSAREEIESTVATELRKRLEKDGFVIESTMLKSLQLPAGLQAAIENKLRAEQEAQQMEFILQRERQEAERKRVEAAGIRDYQNIISEGLSEMLIRWSSIEAFKQLSQSVNAKIIITDGSTPMLVAPESSPTYSPANAAPAIRSAQSAATTPNTRVR